MKNKQKTPDTTLIDVVKAYFLPYDLSTEQNNWDVTMIPAYGSQYMMRCGAMSSLLFGFSGLANDADLEILHTILNVSMYLFAALFGLYLAAVIDTYRK